VDELDKLLDDARLADAVRTRQQQRWLEQVDQEGASLVGALVDLSERGSAMVVETAEGAFGGRIGVVGDDFCVVAGVSGDAWIALGAVTVVRPLPGEQHGAAVGGRGAVNLRFAEALARLVADRPRVTFVVSGGRRMVGTLIGVGCDVASLRLEGEDGGVAYAPLSSLRAVLRSG
jgi:hypothetical protein